MDTPTSTLTFDEYLAEYWMESDDATTAFGHFLDNEHNLDKSFNLDDWTEKVDEFHDSYKGCQPFIEYVEEFERECNEPIPDWLDSHIDWASIARDWLCGDYWTVSDGMGNDYIFRSN